MLLNTSDFADDEDLEPFSSESSDDYVPESVADTDSELENNLPLVTVNDNEISDVEDDIKAQSQTNQTE